MKKVYAGNDSGRIPIRWTEPAVRVKGHKHGSDFRRIDSYAVVAGILDLNCEAGSSPRTEIAFRRKLHPVQGKPRTSLQSWTDDFVFSNQGIARIHRLKYIECVDLNGLSFAWAQVLFNFL